MTELRRRDIIIVEPTEEQLSTAVERYEEPPEAYGIVRVERAVVRVESGFLPTTPKSDAGRRDVEIPPHLLPAVKDHLDERFVGPDKDVLWTALSSLTQLTIDDKNRYRQSWF